jgi:hypothetical protein
VLEVIPKHAMADEWVVNCMEYGWQNWWPHSALCAEFVCRLWENSVIPGMTGPMVQGVNRVLRVPSRSGRTVLVCRRVRKIAKSDC